MALSLQFFTSRFRMRAVIIMAVWLASSLAMPPSESWSISQVGGLMSAMSMRENAEEAGVVAFVCIEEIHDSTIVLIGL